MPVSVLPEVATETAVNGPPAEADVPNGGPLNGHSVAANRDSETSGDSPRTDNKSGLIHNGNETNDTAKDSVSEVPDKIGANLGNGDVNSEDKVSETCNIMDEKEQEVSDRECGGVEKSPLLNDNLKPVSSKSSGPSAQKPDLSRATSCYDNAPDGGCGWVVTFAAFMVGVILDGISFSFGIFYRELLLHFNESKSLTSWIISVLNGTYLGIGKYRPSTLKQLFHKPSCLT